MKTSYALAPSNTVGNEAESDSRPSVVGLMSLVALQFGLQPLIFKTFVRKEVSGASIVVATNLTKILICLSIMWARGSGGRVWRGWMLEDSLKCAAVPAVLYSLQSLLMQIGFRELGSVTYNLLNQTKTLFAAICCYVIMGQKQSLLQVLALFMLVAATWVLNSTEMEHQDTRLSGSIYYYGILCVLGASLLSGLTGAITQRSLQQQGRDPYLLSLELSVYSTVTILVTIGAVSFMSSGLEIAKGWTYYTAIHIVTQALGGILVGQVTKYAGAVKKGLALVGGVMLTALTQVAFEDVPLTNSHIIAGVLVMLGIWIHGNFPHKLQKSIKKA
eukprot:515266_1